MSSMYDWTILWLSIPSCSSARFSLFFQRISANILYNDIILFLFFSSLVEHICLFSFLGFQLLFYYFILLFALPKIVLPNLLLGRPYFIPSSSNASQNFKLCNVLPSVSSRQILKTGCCTIKKKIYIVLLSSTNVFSLFVQILF